MIEEYDGYENNVPDIVEDRLGHLIYKHVVVRKTLKTNKFNIVKETQIQNSFKDLQQSLIKKMSNLTENDLEFTEEDFKEFENSIDGVVKHVINTDKINYTNDDIYKFIDYIESIIENDYYHLTLGVDEYRYYDICIMKQNGDMHKQYIKMGQLKNETPSKLGYIYENGFEKLVNFISFNLLWERPIGYTVNNIITKGNIRQLIKENITVIRKYYGGLVCNINGNFIFKKGTAEDVKDSLTVNHQNGNEILPDKGHIYCGGDKDDIICGFELN